MSELQRYEYLVISDEEWDWTDANKRARQLTDLVNSYAKDGWKAFGVQNCMIYLERPLVVNGPSAQDFADGLTRGFEKSQETQ